MRAAEHAFGKLAPLLIFYTMSALLCPPTGPSGRLLEALLAESRWRRANLAWLRWQCSGSLPSFTLGSPFLLVIKLASSTGASTAVSLAMARATTRLRVP